MQKRRISITWPKVTIFSRFRVKICYWRNPNCLTRHVNDKDRPTTLYIYIYIYRSFGVGFHVWIIGFPPNIFVVYILLLKVSAKSIFSEPAFATEPYAETGVTRNFTCTKLPPPLTSFRSINVRHRVYFIWYIPFPWIYVVNIRFLSPTKG